MLSKVFYTFFYKENRSINSNTLYNMSKLNTRGSKWRKWDLHIHTKDTNKNDNFKSSCFDDFCVVFFKKALVNNVAAIGVTDYFSIDNYKKVKTFQENIESNTQFLEEEKNKIKNIFILPNVELRMTPVTDSQRLVNIHCIFNPNYANNLEHDFFNELTFSTGEQSKHRMNTDGLISLGKSMDTSLSNEAAYQKGLSNFIVSHEQLEKLLNTNKNFRNNTIIVVSNSNKDGVSGFQKHSDLFEENSGDLTALRQSIYRLSDCIFSGNPKDCEYFLGKSSDSIQVVISKCGALKPCIHGSDAHEEDKLFIPDKKRYCWIKANLTFDGLKQILYEPEQRIKIQELEPDIKENHLVIDSVKFYCSDNTFTDKPIIFNRNLNVIIGGKSSGKSLLLTCIAEVLSGKTDLKSKYELYDKVKDFDFEVILSSNGLADKLSNHKSGRKASIIPEIKYIPQNELASLADHQIKKISNKLNKLVRELLREDSQTNLYYEEFLKNVKSYDKEREEIINNYFEKLSTRDDLQKSIFDFGQKNVIASAIDETKKSIKEITDKIGFTEEEKQKYEGLKTNLENKVQEIEQIKADSLLAVDFFSRVTSSLNEIDREKFELTQKLNSDLISSLKEPLKHLRNLLFYNASILGSKRIQKFIDELILKKQEEVKEINSSLEPFTKKIESQIVLENLETKLKDLVEKNKDLHKKEKDLEEIEKRLILIKNELIESYKKSYTEYRTLIENFKSRCSLLENDKLSITGKTFYNYSKFRKLIIPHINGRKTSNWEYERYPILKEKLSSMSSEDAKLETIIFSLNHLFDDVVTNKYSLNQSATAKSFLKILFDDYFYDFWDVKYQNDHLGAMSTGKASFVILMLIVGLSNSKSPLLIDQPEDNLDNRSISKDLVNYLRDKKIERQIILVTHNPNIVVNADAENIIVADQRGQDNDSTCPFLFNYVNGAIEHTQIKNESITDTLNSMGIREHITEIVEGGEEAFLKREQKYNFKKRYR